MSRTYRGLQRELRRAKGLLKSKTQRIKIGKLKTEGIDYEYESSETKLRILARRSGIQLGDSRVGAPISQR